MLLFLGGGFLYSSPLEITADETTPSFNGGMTQTPLQPLKSFDAALHADPRIFYHLS